MEPYTSMDSLCNDLYKKKKQGDLDDAREITAVRCLNVKKTKFRGCHLGFLAAISESILTKFSTLI